LRVSRVIAASISLPSSFARSVSYSVWLRMSIFHPVSLAASLTFCPFFPIARESYVGDDDRRAGLVHGHLLDHGRRKGLDQRLGIGDPGMMPIFSHGAPDHRLTWTSCPRVPDGSTAESLRPRRSSSGAGPRTTF
jgi:hypothetical protein